MIAISSKVDVELSRRGGPSVNVGDSVFVYGFPNYNRGDTGLRRAGTVTGFRTKSAIRRIMVDAHIVKGNSGGPILDKNNHVIGVAVTGADNERDAPDTENHGVIPVDGLKFVPTTPAAERG